MSILRNLAIAGTSFVLAVPLATTAYAETRVALVIGNGAYQNVTHLSNPANDAKLIADALQQDGFNVTQAADLDRDGLAKALRTFGHEADSADWAVIYYAGHGIEMGGINYLIPVDAKLETDRDVGLEAVPLDQVMSAIEGARALRLVILDACRNNPFATTIKRTAGAGRDIGRGLARVEPAKATLVAYSAKDGSIARDGDGANSPYAIALAKHLAEPGLEVDKLFRLVRDDVEEATGKNQEPFVYGSLPGRQDFYFQPATPGIAVTHGGTAAPQMAADQAAWRRIAASSDPIDFESFARVFPDSAHKVEADLKAQLLRLREKPKVAALEPAPSPPEPATACDGGLVASVGNAGVAAAADRCLKPKDTFRDCPNICPEMVVIPPGSFTMGSPTGERDRRDNEGPAHTVTIRSSFAVGKLQITRGQFMAFVSDSGYEPSASCVTTDGTGWKDTAGKSFRDPGFLQDDNHPVVCVSWEDAQAYAAWLARKTGKPYRLLSEAEYEYALRAGTTTPYWFGSDGKKLCAYANGADETAKTRFPSWTVAKCHDGFIYTAPTGSFAANDFGLFDMVGNVWEWTEDCFRGSYTGAPTDGTAWSSAECNYRVFRGGSWGNDQKFLRSAFRDGNTPGSRSSDTGFRVARTL